MQFQSLTWRQAIGSRRGAGDKGVSKGQVNQGNHEGLGSQRAKGARGAKRGYSGPSDGQGRLSLLVGRLKEMPK
jgi:hypothetical protein